jgi:coenzyme F420-reducing hydrogenase beta subunit
MNYLKAALANEPYEEPHVETAATVPTLASRADCTGCTACAAVCPVSAITMKADGEGFLRPVVGESCVKCHRCEQTCPILQEAKAGTAPDHVYAVWNNNEDERAVSSSGGVFSLLARRTLEQGGAVFGSVMDEHMTARHVCARSMEELAPMRGSKYVQSDLGDTFKQAKELLDQNAPVLFSGVPCQIDGLRKYLGKDYENLTTCDLVCHGVPSPAVFRAYLDRLEQTHGAKAAEVRFKDKSHSWGTPYFTVRFENGEVYSEEFNCTGYGRGFGMQLFLRPSCARCRYADVSRRPADFTLADYWGLDEKLELPVARDKGVSMVMANTAKGMSILDELSPNLGRIQRPLSEAVAGNPRLASPLTANQRREEFFAAFALEPFEQVEKAYLAQPPAYYRAAAKVLSPEMKAKIRKFIK